MDTSKMTGPRLQTVKTEVLREPAKAQENLARFEEILKRPGVYEPRTSPCKFGHRYAISHNPEETWCLADDCLLYASGPEYAAPYKQI